MLTGMHCLLVGGINYWQDTIVTFGSPGMTSNVTEAWINDKGRGGRCITGVWEGTKQKCNWPWGHGNATSRHRGVMGAWLRVVQECTFGHMGRQLQK